MEHSSSNPWDWIYATRDPTTVGWFEPDPSMSRELIAEAVAWGATSLIDIGGGASRLIDRMLDLDPGLERIAVLDISEAGLAIAQHRLGPRSDRVEWIVGDATDLADVGRFDIWHDRAMLHFELDPAARRRYVALAERTVPVGGTAVIATFADDGPERCSGMPVHRFHPDALAEEFAPAFRRRRVVRYLHHTPAGVPQRFQYSVLERTSSDGPDDGTS